MSRVSDRDENGFRGFEWKGKVVRTYGEIGQALCDLETPAEAAAFFTAYHSINEYAAGNIGYLMGYYGDEERRRVYGLFDAADIGVVHPIFGGNFGRD